MCYPVRCPRCGKTSWAGCGQHADSVMRAVPASQRCQLPKRRGQIATQALPPRSCWVTQTACLD